MAVFLDRDGVLTEPVWNPATEEYESPHHLVDLRLCPNVTEPLRQLGERGFELFIVSNQPSYAKGKTSLESIRSIARTVEDRLRAVGVSIREGFYCYHHPRGIVPEYTGACPCRKPGTHFLEEAAAHYDLDLGRSWMIGDRDTDVECGQRAGCRTVLIAHPHAGSHQGANQPTYVARDLAEAASLILTGAVASIGTTTEGRS